MRLEARKYLLDVQVAADRIGRVTRGKSFVFAAKPSANPSRRAASPTAASFVVTGSV